MKPTRIWYKRLFNRGNYQNEEIGIEVEIESGDSATDAYKRARRFVEAKDEEQRQRRESERLWAKNILEHPSDRLVRDVERARAILEMPEPTSDDVPF